MVVNIGRMIWREEDGGSPSLKLIVPPPPHLPNPMILPSVASSHSSTRPDTDNTNTDAWIDVDDEHLAVSLAKSSNRIRKLRTSSMEDVVDVVEYEERLRRKFRDTSSARTDWAHVEPGRTEDEDEGFGMSSVAARLLSG